MPCQADDIATPIDADQSSASARTEPAVVGMIALGGMVGAAARHAVEQLLPIAPGRFPWATFWTNVAGSFALGVALVVLVERLPRSRLLRPFLTTGILGALTTMSTFLVQTVVLAKDDHVAIAITYGVATVLAGIAAAVLGLRAARALPGRSRTAMTHR